MAWVSLHQHSQFSILESTAPVKALVKKAFEYQMPALALTDQGNLHGAVDFYKACQEKGIKPIIGCELYVAPQSRHEKKRIPGEKAGYPIVLLAKNKEGYQNLCQLSSLAHLEGFYYTPRIDKELLGQYASGLVCLSGPVGGKIAQLIGDDKEEELEEEIAFYHHLFDEDFYLELNRHKMDESQMRFDGMDRESWLFQASMDFQEKQEKITKRLVQLGKERGIPIVATNDSRYIAREDWQALEVLMNISSGEPCEIWQHDSQGNRKNRILNPKRKVRLTHELYFKSSEQMNALFSDYPEAISQSLEISGKCLFDFDFQSKFYPVFTPPQLENTPLTPKRRQEEAALFLENLCKAGIEERYTPLVLERLADKWPEKDSMEVVKERLKYELELIVSKGLCDYLLIVYDFIDWAKKRNIPVGPGRGSAVGSIVCYLIGITDIEPLRFNLFFERFINPERVSYPDIDVDICMERRSEVIEYTMSKYGKDHVAQIITFGRMKAKMAVKDVGRVLSVSLAKVNDLAKLIPEDLNMTLDRAIELDPELAAQYAEDEETKRLIDLAKILEGSVRNTGIHAAGLIICADPLTQHIPICRAKDGSTFVTQYAMKPVEAVGMLKIDFLGLKTLTAIQVAVNAIAEHLDQKINWVDLPLDDKRTFDLLNQGKTLGLFQLESGGMQALARKLHIDKFEEIIAVGALYRPGPMENIPSFISRKHGEEKIEFDHPKMRDILEETYGIMVYQEQVMMIAQKLAGYSLGQGDLLRKAMGKKDWEEMNRQREKFRKGAKESGIDEKKAMEIFDKVEKFASYGFNKSHATAYGYMSYVTAYLKANYPNHWMAALMTSDRDDLSKVTKILRECQAMEIPILPPDVNESGVAFVATKGGIRFAMTAVKGVGEGVVEAIIEERKKGGMFTSLHDFIKRVPTQKVGKKVIESLIEAGGFDFTGWGRGQLIASVEPMYQRAQKEQKDKERGELSFFSMMGEDTQFATPPSVGPIDKIDVLRREKELLGFYLTGHPLDDVEHLFKRLSCIALPKLLELENGALCRTAFVIESVTVRLASRTGKKFAVLRIGDRDAQFELPIWSDLFEEKGHLLEDNHLIYAVVQVAKDPDGKIRLQCRWLDDLSRADEEMIKACDLAYDRAQIQSKIGAKMGKRGGSRLKIGEGKEEKKGAAELHFLVVKIEVAKLEHSHILDFKKIFRSQSGNIPIEIQFIEQGKELKKIQIESTYGVSLSATLKDLLDRHPSVIDISAVKR